MTNHAPKFITYSAFRDALPHPIPRQQLLRLSRIGRFPEFVRARWPAIGTPFFGKRHQKWFRDKYGTLLPAYVDMIEREGFDAKPSFHGEPSLAACVPRRAGPKSTASFRTALIVLIL